MCSGSFDEQDLKSSESWLGRYYSSVLPSRVPGKKMWKKGRGTTKWKVGRKLGDLKLAAARKAVPLREMCLSQPRKLSPGTFYNFGAANWPAGERPAVHRFSWFGQEDDSAVIKIFQGIELPKGS
jgi:hypothetical protein